MHNSAGRVVRQRRAYHVIRKIFIFTSDNNTLKSGYRGYSLSFNMFYSKNYLLRIWTSLYYFQFALIENAAPDAIFHQIDD